VFDEHCLLDRLLQLPDLRPTTNDLIAEFDELLEELSDGPTLSEADKGMLVWLTTNIEMLDPKGENPAYCTAYAAARVLRGTSDQIEHFLLAALSHRVQNVLPTMTA
jgi:hypothetical protein